MVVATVTTEFAAFAIVSSMQCIPIPNQGVGQFRRVPRQRLQRACGAGQTALQGQAAEATEARETKLKGSSCDGQRCE